MIKKDIDTILSDEKLGEVIYSPNGDILLHKGATLTPNILKRLKQRGYNRLSILDKRFVNLDIQSSSPLSEEVKQEALTVSKKILSNYSEKGQIEIGREIFSVASNIVDDLLSNREVGVEISSIQDYDEGTYIHSLGMTILSLALAQEIGLPKKDLQEIAIGCLLHDVGKLNIPKEVLNKPGKLTDEEFGLIKQHPTDGYRMIKDKIPLKAAHIALQHHEKLDGTGYPRNLKGTDIHLYGRITALADVYEAITADRPYRKGLSKLQAVEILMKSANTHFQPDLLDSFLNILTIYPNGTLLTLSGNRKGIVCEQNKNNPLYPKVFIYEEDYIPLTSYYLVDLLKDKHITIENII